MSCRAVLATTLLTALVGGCGIGDSQTRLRTAVDERQDALSSCYADALTRNPSAQGTVQARLHVEDDQGRIDRVEIVRSDIADDQFHTCFTQALQQVQLSEAPPANLDVAYTFQLRPGPG